MFQASRTKLLRLALIASAFTGFAPSFAQENFIALPYDFVWGEALEEVTFRHGSIGPEDFYVNLDTYRISDLPEAPFPLEIASVRVAFSRDVGLVVVDAYSVSFDDTDEGTEARRLFAALVEDLTGTLGEGQVHIVGPREPWPAPDQFYECVLNTFCGFLSAYWGSCSTGTVAIEFVPEQRRRGHFVVKYHHPGAMAGC